MRVEISVEAYCQAFETWARLARPPAEQALIAEGTAHLRAAFSGDVPIGTLCRALVAWSEEQPGNHTKLRIAVVKSCLLNRLIYAQEPLRTTPCPIHLGEWSGCPGDICPAGCNFGWDLTGWLPAPAPTLLPGARSDSKEPLH